MLRGEFPRLGPNRITQSPHGPLHRTPGFVSMCQSQKREIEEAKKNERKKTLKWYRALGMVERRSGTVYLSERWRECVALCVRRFLSSSLKAHLPYISPAPCALLSFTHRCHGSPIPLPLGAAVPHILTFNDTNLPPLHPSPHPPPPCGVRQAMGTQTWINRLAPPRSLPPPLLLLAVFV